LSQLPETAHSGYWPPLAGGFARKAGAGGRCARRSPKSTELPSQPEPKIGRSAETHADTPGNSPLPPHGPAVPSAVGDADCPSAARAPAERPPRWVTISRAQRPSSSSSTERSSFNLWREHSVGRLPSSPTRAFWGAHGVPRSCRRRQPGTVPNSRSVWSAPACWRCRGAPLRPETYRPRPTCLKRPKFCTTPPDTPCTAQLNAVPERENSSCLAEACRGVGGPATAGTHRPAFAWADRRPCLPHSGGKPPQSMRRCDSARRPPRSRSVWSAPACWRYLGDRYCPPECYPPTHGLHARRIRCSVNST